MKTIINTVITLKHKYFLQDGRHQIKGMEFQLASYILNPSLKDEMKDICDFYGLHEFAL